MFHANGWTFVWVVTAVGGTHICLRKVEPDGVFRILRQESATVLCAAPTVLISLANTPQEKQQDLPRCVRVLTAGAPPAAATIERIEETFGWEVTQLYGLTETSPFITICEPRPEHRLLPLDKRGLVKSRQGVELITSGELRVVDGVGCDVPNDGKTLGEIVARGNSVMKGYYLDDEATLGAMRGGWFHTGDVAVVHPDGYVEICDRQKDVIISGGENISSIEVEGVLLRHSAVLEVAVVGLPHEKWGEAPHAFVVLKAGTFATESDVCEFARANMAHFKAPQGVTFLSELPKTATGKIQKYLLRRNRPAISKQ
jgi:fatty-acyl-CoA synthase